MGLDTYIKLVRFPNALLSGVGALLSVLVYVEYSLNPSLHSLLVIGFITGFSLTGSCMIINDIVDLEVDKVNKPWKPLPRGDLSIRAALTIAINMALLSIVLNFFFGLTLFAVTLLYAVVGIAYSFLRRHWWSHFLVAFSTTGPVIYGYVATGLPARDLYFTVLFSFTIFTVTLGREFLKAIQDVEGDRIHSYRTIATALGVEKASRATLFVSLIGSILGLATTTLSAGGVYKVLITIASILYSYSMFRALTRLSDREVLEGTRRKTLQAMALGMAAFWLSKLP